ncbi:MAG: sulfite exporter TauE/SafE family protein [Chitinophagaceae bacterium]|nr:sulfite exporter TauE/SafE family protein [Chitinophagaceae bacterium]
MNIFNAYTITEWQLILLAAFLIGLGKAGLKGVDMLAITLMALVFGGKSSTGVVLPLLCIADIAAVRYYHRHAQWAHFRKLFPWMAVGILLGVWLGKDLNEQVFRQLMAGIVVVTIAIVLGMELRKSAKVPGHPAFAAGTGLAAGFTTMMGNLAGAFANLYFLAMRMPKNDFIGTAAWLFLVINLFKLPFQAFYWKNINTTTLLTDLGLLPALAAGFWAGLYIVAKLRDTGYRKMVLVITLAGAIIMLLKR